MNDILFSAPNQEPLNELRDELNVTSEMIRTHIEKGSKDNSNPEAYLKEYESLVIRYKKTEEKYNFIIKQKEKKRVKAVKLALFIKQLKKCENVPIEFDKIIFHHLVSKAVVTKDGFIIFHIKNGTSIKLAI